MWPLSEPRSYARAATLADGDVLLVGGMERSPGLSLLPRAELFDLQSWEWRPVGDPRPGRLWHTVTSLSDDRVLVAGGVIRRPEGGWDPLDLVDVFDPWAGEWHAAAPLRVARSDHSAALLKDGRVLVAGGHRGSEWLRSAEIYDPARDVWDIVRPLPRARSLFTMTTLPDGTVLAVGGTEEGPMSATSVIYDPVRDRWSDGPSLSHPRVFHSAVQLPSGDVMLIGGQRYGANTAERYDVRLGAFVYAGTLAMPRMFAQAAVADDGSVVLAGGILRPTSPPGFVPNSFAERWDPSTNYWSLIPNTKAPRAGAAFVQIGGSVCLVGGSTQDDLPVATVECLR
jgi:Kelch motif protein